MSIYDIIIVGGGISGLYAAYKIKLMRPATKLLVLESSSKHRLGGRAGTEIFNGVHVSIGAGIGRKQKDFLLFKLLDELNIPTTSFKKESSYANTIQPTCHVKKTFILLRNKYNTLNDKHKTFKEYALSIIGDAEYNNFIICSGFTDYENEEAYNTLYNYGFDDNYNSWDAIGVPWKTLIDKLIQHIDMRNICTSSHVISIENINKETTSETHNPMFTIHLGNGKQYVCNKIIIATTIASVMKLLPCAKEKDSPYRQIHGQPFLRIYGKFANSCIPLLKQYIPNHTIVPGPLHNIIPMNSDEGVYMIAYTDNKGALFFKKHRDNNATTRNFLCRLIEKSMDMPVKSLQLTSIIDYYWDIGTHYYEPLRGDYVNRKTFIDTAQRPYKDILVVGEMISTDQGWVQGALQSVDKVLIKKWIMS